MSKFLFTISILLGAMLMGCQTVPTADSGYPIYPEEAAAKCIRGLVEFRYRLDEKRMVTDFEILYSDPPGLFDEATRKNVEMYQYKEIYRGGWQKTYLEYEPGDDCVPSAHNKSLKYVPAYGLHRTRLCAPLG